MPKTGRDRSRGYGDLVRIRWARRKSRRTPRLRYERARARSDERTRDRRAARDRGSARTRLLKIWSRPALRPMCCAPKDGARARRLHLVLLERFFGFAYVARASFEACVFLQ